MSTTNDQLGTRAKEVTDDLQNLGGVVRDAAREKFEQVSEKASECFEQGRDKAHGLACACEQFVSERPLKSIMIAAGIGWLIGRLWKRR